jgi:hypothetical protein
LGSARRFPGDCEASIYALDCSFAWPITIDDQPGSWSQWRIRSLPSDPGRHAGLGSSPPAQALQIDSVRISGDKYKYHGWVCLEQREWIKEELSRIPLGTPVVVVLHIPLVTAFYNITEGATFQAKPNRDVVNNTDVLALFAEHNLVLVLQGHLHVSELLRWRSTTFITGGAICAKWWRGPYFGTEEDFNAITLRRDRVEWEYLDYGWHARHPAGK